MLDICCLQYKIRIKAIMISQLITHVPKSDFSSNKKSFSWLTSNRFDSECILSLHSYRMNCKKYHKRNTGAGAVLVWSLGITWLVCCHRCCTSSKGPAFSEIVEPIKADLCSLILIGAVSEKNTGIEGWQEKHTEEKLWGLSKVMERQCVVCVLEDPCFSLVKC